MSVSALLVLSTSTGLASDKAPQPDPELLEFLGSWEQANGDTVTDVVELLDAWLSEGRTQETSDEQ